MGPVVLCIDNRQINLEAEERLLQSSGFCVFTARNWEQAVSVLERENVEVALVSDDLRHSEIHTCARIRELRPEVAIVLQCASFAQPEIPGQVDEIIPKTTHPEQKLRLLERFGLRRAA